MSLFLGNLSARQMCDRLGIEYTQQIADMELARQHNANVKRGTDKWHCFDIPFFVMCGSYEVAEVWRDLLTPAEHQMKEPISFGIVTEAEDSPQTEEAVYIRDSASQTCGTCKHYLGGGDFGTCCDQTYDLKYEKSKACEKYEIVLEASENG